MAMVHTMRSAVCVNQVKAPSTRAVKAPAALADCWPCGVTVSVVRHGVWKRKLTLSSSGLLPFLSGQRKRAMSVPSGLLEAAEASGARCFSTTSVAEERAAGASLRVTKPVQVHGLESLEKRNVVVNAAAAGEASQSEAAAEPSGAASVEASVSPIAALKLQSDLLKKKAKKLELRRKRLVRKRHLRKKGRWPPSKMKKNKNV